MGEPSQNHRASETNPPDKVAGFSHSDGSNPPTPPPPPHHTVGRYRARLLSSNLVGRVLLFMEFTNEEGTRCHREEMSKEDGRGGI